MVASMRIDAFDPHETSISRLRLGPHVYLTKRPGDLAALGPRLRWDREFYAICLMRDPRDVIVSRHGKDPQRYWSSLRIWKQRLPIVRGFLGHERFLLVSYEELVTQPDAVGARIATWLPFLESVRPFSAFSKVATPSAAALEALGPIRPFDAASIGNWKKHLSRVAGQLARHGPISEELIELGYERDSAWLSMLDGITPDDSLSRLGDRPRHVLRRGVERIVLPWISTMALRLGRVLGVQMA